MAPVKSSFSAKFALTTITRILIYGVFIPLFGLAAFDKFSGPVPDWFLKQFSGTILALIPGISISYYGIATLEALTTLLFIASFLKGEFRNEVTSRKLLTLSFIAAETTFCVLGIGLRIAHDFNTAFQLFAYFVLTVLLSKSILGNN